MLLLTITATSAQLHHIARIVEGWKRQKSVQEWPALSADLNSIEEVWAYLKHQLQCMVLDHENLEQAVMDIWNKIPTDFFSKLVPVNA